LSNYFNIAVVGATGVVGREFLIILENRAFPVNHLKLLASRRSVGTRISVGGQEYEVQEATEDSFRNIDFAFISAGASVSRRFVPAAVNSGAVAIDKSSAYRMDPTVPLVVPEINGADVERHQGIIATPNCSTIQMVMAMCPLHRVNPIRRVIVDTYQAASGAGAGAVQELTDQAQAILTGAATSAISMPHTLAFNLFPHIDDFLDDGYSKEEEKMINETRKILHDPYMGISATCVRVPVYTCHSEAVHLEFEHPMDPAEATELLEEMPGVSVFRDSYPMPQDLAGTDDVYVGRIRRDPSIDNGLALWIVADNLRKGAALNALQIAEEVVRRDCLKPKFLAASPEA
jgi:aspartate-semialdehyde dehydrogenase